MFLEFRLVMCSRFFRSAISAAALLCVFGSSPAGAQEADALLARGMELHQAGDLLGAVQNYEIALEAQPDRADIRSNLGAAYVGLGRIDDGIEQYRKALETKDVPSIRQNLALALYKSGRTGDAAAEFERVLAADPGNKPAALLLADSLLNMGRYQPVIDLLTPRAAEFGEDLAYAYVLGTALLQVGDTERGQVLIDRIFRNGESAEAHLLMGMAHVAKRDFVAAHEELTKAMAINSDLPSLQAAYGRVQLGMGDREAAMRAFRRELEHNPNSFEAAQQLGTLYRVDQRYQEAMRYLKRAEALQPHDPLVRQNIAAAHLGLGEAERARELLEALVADAPTYIDAHVLLATTYYRLKRKDDGDRERQVVERLTAEAQAKQPQPKPDGPAAGAAPPPGPPSPESRKN
jgi:tetratricopeptide (TPR) repeat protein